MAGSKPKPGYVNILISTMSYLKVLLKEICRPGVIAVPQLILIPHDIQGIQHFPMFFMDGEDTAQSLDGKTWRNEGREHEN